jgi:hypothetical protein
MALREIRMHGDQEWIFLSPTLKRISHCAKVFGNYYIVFYRRHGEGGMQEKLFYVFFTAERCRYYYEFVMRVNPSARKGSHFLVCDPSFQQFIYIIF